MVKIYSPGKGGFVPYKAPEKVTITPSRTWTGYNAPSGGGGGGGAPAPSAPPGSVSEMISELSRAAGPVKVGTPGYVIPQVTIRPAPISRITVPTIKTPVVTLPSAVRPARTGGGGGTTTQTISQTFKGEVTAPSIVRPSSEKLFGETLTKQQKVEYIRETRKQAEKTTSKMFIGLPSPLSGTASSFSFGTLFGRETARKITYGAGRYLAGRETGGFVQKKVPGKKGIFAGSMVAGFIGGRASTPYFAGEFGLQTIKAPKETFYQIKTKPLDFGASLAGGAVGLGAGIKLSKLSPRAFKAGTEIEYLQTTGRATSKQQALYFPRGEQRFFHATETVTPFTGGFEVKTPLKGLGGSRLRAERAMGVQERGLYFGGPKHFISAYEGGKAGVTIKAEITPFSKALQKRIARGESGIALRRDVNIFRQSNLGKLIPGARTSSLGNRGLGEYEFVVGETTKLKQLRRDPFTRGLNILGRASKFGVREVKYPLAEYFPKVTKKYLPSFFGKIKLKSSDIVPIEEFRLVKPERRIKVGKVTKRIKETDIERIERQLGTRRRVSTRPTPDIARGLGLRLRGEAITQRPIGIIRLPRAITREPSLFAPERKVIPTREPTLPPVLRIPRIPKEPSWLRPIRVPTKPIIPRIPKIPERPTLISRNVPISKLITKLPEGESKRKLKSLLKQTKRKFQVTSTIVQREYGLKGISLPKGAAFTGLEVARARSTTRRKKRR